MPTFFRNAVGWHTWEVPPGVTLVDIELVGGGSNPARGGRVRGRLHVAPGQVLYLLVGQGGRQNEGASGGGRTTAPANGGPGGDGRTTGPGGGGGWGGAGGSVLRLAGPPSSPLSGTIKAVAGGAGGRSGDGGNGGDGGPGTGAHGTPASHGDPDKVTNATGGDQSWGGRGGTIKAAARFNGGDAELGPLAPAGKGGQGGPNDHYYGGGGGGGGYHSGGGGHGSNQGTNVPGGGGAGGSNYVGGLTQAESERGNGSTGNGNVRIDYPEPHIEEQPSPPTDIKIDDHTEEAEYATLSTGTVTVTAEVNDPEEQPTRMLVRLSTSNQFETYTDSWSGYVPSGERATVVLTGLAQNTLYHGQLWAMDQGGLVSEQYNAISFWTNRPPGAPRLVAPLNGVTVPSNTPISFEWVATDLDGEAHVSQAAFEFRWRRRATITVPAGQWTSVSGGRVQGWVSPADIFKGNYNYEWAVRTMDAYGALWGPWAEAFSFSVESSTTPPLPLGPINDAAVMVDFPITFNWLFADPDPDDTQTRADLRYRAAGTEAWNEIFGDPVTPGPDGEWVIGAHFFDPDYRYEWQARTVDSAATTSDWSESGFFWGILSPGWAVTNFDPPVPTPVLGSLGCGTYRVFAYERGGQHLVGEITPLAGLTFTRLRDDISNALMRTNGFGKDAGELLGSLRCWQHELVIFRDGERVWEGPITRLGYTTTDVEIEAKDVMAYLYRRVMRQGYNDAYNFGTYDPNGTNIPTQYGLRTVVDRATIITVNALAPYDPNVLPYLTTLRHPGDARQARVVNDFNKSVWEEVDDMAATAGLDYTTVGRRIMYWDTHQPIGRLPEMRDGDFSNPPIVTEYGMLLANMFVVTSNTGLYGTYTVPEGTNYYGPVEQIASAYGEAQDDEPTEVDDPEQRAEIVAALETQALRNIAGRWPTPVVVRVPDNSTLNPDISVAFDHLIPGVWIPLRASATCRDIAQWQKLDSVGVAFSDGQETVSVVMSPAPRPDEDLDITAPATD